MKKGLLRTCIVWIHENELFKQSMFTQNALNYMLMSSLSSRMIVIHSYEDRKIGSSSWYICFIMIEDMVLVIPPSLYANIELAAMQIVRWKLSHG